MKKLITTLCLLFSFAMIAQNIEQVKNQIDDAILSSYDKSILSVYTNAKKKTTSYNSFIDITPKSTDCANKPSLEEIKLGPFYYTDKFYTLKQAYKLGIPIVNLDFSKNISIYVRDYMRKTPCKLDNENTIVNYGQSIRTVIEIEDFDAGTSIDIASIAAKGTLNKKKQSFYLYKDGFYNPKIDAIIMSVTGKPFDVENYTTYQNVMSSMISLLADPATQFQVSKLGVERLEGDKTFLEEAPIITFVLSKIQKGKPYSSYIDKFKDNIKAVEVIQRTYNILEMNYNENIISEENRQRAKKYLQGIID
ncbi:hypothetical protein [Chryseobacterium indologenes]|uniref:hypothetical protein n=1 Tax=Chryseobacterium indologenes TaxID=253 RepID=UPI0016274994|nr:hypothetical protein [Chryseobacterium indologenes]